MKKDCPKCGTENELRAIICTKFGCVYVFTNFVTNPSGDEGRAAPIHRTYMVGTNPDFINN